MQSRLLIWGLVFVFWCAVFEGVAWFTGDYTWSWLDMLIRAGSLTFMCWLIARAQGDRQWHR